MFAPSHTQTLPTALRPTELCLQVNSQLFSTSECLCIFAHRLPLPSPVLSSFPSLSKLCSTDFPVFLSLIPIPAPSCPSFLLIIPPKSPTLRQLSLHPSLPLRRHGFSFLHTGAHELNKHPHTLFSLLCLPRILSPQPSGCLLTSPLTLV